MTYQVSLEVSAPLAMFARSDTGATPTSYPVPTWSGTKGILESIAMFSDGAAYFVPRKVEICRRKGAEGGISYQRYTTNYAGPLRKTALVRSGNGMQLIATILSNVCYRLYADVQGGTLRHKHNPAHHLHDLFVRRLKRGQSFHTPAMGWREFTCDYWGDFRDDYEVDTDVNLIIPSIMHSVWSEACRGVYAPKFMQNVEIKNGVLIYAE